MPSFLHRLKSAWDTFVLGRPVNSRGEQMSYRLPNSYSDFRRSSRQSKVHYPAPPITTDPKQAEHDWHEDPLVGRFVRTKYGTWWTDTLLKSLGYEVQLRATGEGPTAAQMADLEALAARIPELITEANLEPIPEVDPWGAKAPPFDMHTARIDDIIMKADGTYCFSLTVDPSGDYMGAPLFYVAQDHSLIKAEWAI